MNHSSFPNFHVCCTQTLSKDVQETANNFQEPTLFFQRLRIHKITPSKNNKTALGNLESISVSQKDNQLCQGQTIICHLLLARCCSNCIFNIF